MWQEYELMTQTDRDGSLFETQTFDAAIGFVDLARFGAPDLLKLNV
jgi:hypothetical protein